jgi:YgiT-type zinc finger domain-containing protein
MSALETGRTDWLACPTCRATTLHREEQHTLNPPRHQRASLIDVTLWRCVQCGHPTTEGDD